MRKLIIFLTFFLICLSFIPEKQEVQSVIGINKIDNNYYQLDFSNELLNFRNFKLKLGLFTSYNYNIKKVYIKYPKKIEDYISNKKYFSFDSSNFNKGIEKIKEEYNILLKDNYLYDELENDIDNTVIERVDIYTQEEALEKLKSKYPNIIINRINN